MHKLGFFADTLGEELTLDIPDEPARASLVRFEPTAAHSLDDLVELTQRGCQRISAVLENREVSRFRVVSEESADSTP